MTPRSRMLIGGLVVVSALIVVFAVTLGFPRSAEAQAPPTGYENLVLCSMPGGTKAEAQYATGLTTLFSETFTVRVRNWKWLASAKMWHGEWWLRDSTGSFAWVPVGTSMTCSFYPYDMDLDWIVQ